MGGVERNSLLFVGRPNWRWIRTNHQVEGNYIWTHRGPLERRNVRYPVKAGLLGRRVYKIVYQHRRAVLAFGTFHTSNEDVCIAQERERTYADISQRLEIIVKDVSKRG